MPPTTPPPTHHRQDEKQQLHEALNHGRNIHIYGRRGHGKTHLTQHVTDIIDPPTAYLRCTQHDTEHKALQRLHTTLTDKPTDNSNSTADLKEQIGNHLTDNTIIVILDDITFHHDPDQLLYWLGNHPAIQTITISNQTGNLTQLCDDRTVSRLHPYHLHLNDYTKLDTAEILTYYVNQMNIPTTKRAITRIAIRTNDIAYAQTWLTTANQTAEDIVTAPLITQTRFEARRRHEDHLLQDFTEHHHALLEAVYQLVDSIDPVTTTGTVIDQYQDLCEAVGTTPRTHRRATDFLDDLDKLDILDVTTTGGGKDGDTRKIQLQKL